MNRTPRTILLATSIVLLAVPLGGCMKNHRMEQGRIDELYQPSADLWLEAQPMTLQVGQQALPNRVVLIREQSLHRSVLSLASLRGRIFTGQDDLQLLIADQVAQSVADILRQIADRTGAWGQKAETYPTDAGRDEWVDDTAGILALLYVLDRGEAAVDPRQLTGGGSDAVVVAPVIRSMITYMMKRMEIETGQDERLLNTPSERRLPIEFVLQGAFRLAGLVMPPGAPDEVLHVFEGGPPTAIGVERQLQDVLLELRKAAEEDRRPPSNEKLILALKAVPLALNNMARVLEQWDKFYLVSMEVGKVDGQEMVSLVIDVQPGREVRIDAIHSMAPVVTMQGRVRINLMSSDTEDAGTTRVQLVNERGGRIVVRFESWVYGLASLFAFPIEDWGLREVTVVRTRPERHRRVTDVELELQADNPKSTSDPRRVMRIHTVRNLDVKTHQEIVDRIVKRDTTFEFFRPEQMWYYERTSRESLPKP
ncbi:MAG: hypothetical protein JXL80_08650 [Planctomycetes bacterium]|nr:hypothetical protein [Planctomycetota bacterium]